MSTQLLMIKAKKDAHYICQECGSTEYIQAHHQVKGDDTSIIVLCAECHSKRHPHINKSIFMCHIHQPYWNNKSIITIAKECGAHPRTIKRRALDLGISKGYLSQDDEEKLKIFRKHYGVNPYKNRLPKEMIKKAKSNCIHILDCYNGHHEMSKYGVVWSGRHKSQRYICKHCGKSKMIHLVK